jgi:hypothetical protein
MIAEAWQPISGFEGLYEVSTCGRIRNVRTQFVLRSRPDADGYRLLTLWKGSPTKAHTVKVHRIVAHAFIANPQCKPCINHKDFDRANNAVSNLIWVAVAENIECSRAAGRMPGAGHRPVIAFRGSERFQFPSVLSVKAFGFNRKAVHLVLRGSQQTHHGFSWSYT